MRKFGTTNVHRKSGDSSTIQAGDLRASPATRVAALDDDTTTAYVAETASSNEQNNQGIPAPPTTLGSRFSTTSHQTSLTLAAQKRAARRVNRTAKKSSLDDATIDVESNSNEVDMTPDHTSHVSPGAFSVPGNNSLGSPHNNHETESRLDQDLGRPLSLIIAAQLVDNVEMNVNGHDEEDLELKIQQEVESRLMRRDQNIVVAEVFNTAAVPDHASCAQLCRKWKYPLLLIMLCIGGAIAGISIWAASRVEDPPTVMVTDAPTPAPTLAPTLDRRQTEILRTLESHVNTTHFQDKNSPQSRALDWLLFNDTNTLLLSGNAPPYVVLERYALAVLFYSTTVDDATWQNQLQFLTSSDVCNWNDGSQVFSEVSETFGVYCEESQVAQFRLSGNGLVGTIPSELSLLSNLQVLGLENNDLEGSIPTELGSLTALQRLFIHSNSIGGNLPTELGRLTAMWDFLIHTNNFIGVTLPTEIGYLTALQYFDIYDGRFVGTLPTEVGRLTNVQRFHLYRNFMNGTLPTELGSMASLISFRAQSNKFTGTLPTELGRLTNLQQLYVNDNVLIDPIPTEVLNLTNVNFVFYPQVAARARRNVK